MISPNQAKNGAAGRLPGLSTRAYSAYPAQKACMPSPNPAHRKIQPTRLRARSTMKKPVAGKAISTVKKAAVGQEISPTATNNARPARKSRIVAARAARATPFARLCCQPPGMPPLWACGRSESVTGEQQLLSS
jgi:hypothetical protein